MKTYQFKSRGKSLRENVAQETTSSAPPLQFVDNRPEAITQRNLQRMINNSPQVTQLKSLQERVNNGVREGIPVQRTGDEQTQEDGYKITDTDKSLASRRIGKSNEWMESKAEMMKRIGKLQGDGTAEVKRGFEQFADQLVTHPGTTGDEGKEKEIHPAQRILIEGTIVPKLHKIKGFQVPYYWYLENQGDPNFKEELGKKAADAPTKGRLWSKMNAATSKKEADKTGGIVLESSVAGVIMNRLNFGFGWGESKAMQHLWDLLSENYVKSLTGTVEADVLEGIDPDSVLSNLEIHKLLEKVKKGEIKSLKVNIYKVGDNGDLVKDGDPIEVTDMEQWKAIKTVSTKNDAVFREKQQKVNEQEMGKDLAYDNEQMEKVKKGKAEQNKLFNAIHDQNKIVELQ